MRRALNAALGYPAGLARDAISAWDAFWFTPADPTLMGVLRVLSGLMLIYTHAVWGLALEDFFGPSSWMSPELVGTLQADSFAGSFWWLVPRQYLWHAYAASMVALALYTIGLWTRVTSVLALVVTISFAHRAWEALFGLDQINVLLALYLTIGDAGRAVSIDRLRAIRRGAGPPAPSARSNLGLRLIQFHMCVIYLFAGLGKLQGPAWWNGEAMWLAFANQEYQSVDMTWLAWHPWAINLMTHLTIAWEVFYCALIWNRRLRPLMLAAAVVTHLGIGACLGMWTFGLIMLVGNAAFLPPDGVRDSFYSLLKRRRREAPAPPAIPAPRIGRYRVPEAEPVGVLRVDYQADRWS